MIFQFSIGLAAPRRGMEGRGKVSPGSLSRNEILVICSHSSEGTHKRTYRIRSKVHSELVLHIIVSTAYTSTIFKKNKN